MITHCILFYKYAPLSSDKDVMTLYQDAMKELCISLKLTGRVLIGLSENAEGINGTLAGEKENVLCYTYAMLGKQWCIDNQKLQLPTNTIPSTNVEHHNHHHHHHLLLQRFFQTCETFAQRSNVPIPIVDSQDDFKWSSSDSDDELFPDLQIKLVKEIISTGGVLSSISIQETSKDYLTPEEWHDEMKRLVENKNDQNKSNDTILIDCRNHKEFAVGHFDQAIDPNTKIFAQFPRWVQENKSALKDKKVLMYCTGGIRCEKASAYIRNELKDVSSSSSVYHLKGGIHKYLDQFAGDGYFRGKNFVFDRRLTMDAEEHKRNDLASLVEESSSDCQKQDCVGKCQYCDTFYDNFTGDRVCTVCRELVLVCEDCKSKLNGEFHCMDHMHLRNCYFTNLGKFSKEELKSQLQELEKKLDEIAVGKRYKQKRQTLHKQCEKIRNILDDTSDEINTVNVDSSSCRSCGEESCNGECWGVHGLKRRNQLEKRVKKKVKKPTRLSANNRPSKIAQKQKEIEDIKRLKLSEAPHVHRNNETSLRCPPPCIRILSSSVKGKWCGKTIRSVMSSEFYEFSDPTRLDEMFRHNLIQIDGVPVNSEAALRRGTDANKALSPDTLLKNMDTISRFQYWHEPPVLVPHHIDVECTKVPEIVCNELIPNFNEDGSDDDFTIYCCDKPSTVPVHPAGPYYQNSLLLMLEAQEGLETKSLLPCHRLDRCTSGLTICCTNPKIARLMQVQMDLKAVSKMYLARVKGSFPNNEDTSKQVSANISWSWSNNNNCVEVDAPIDVIDIQSGIRGIKETGKSAQSRFQFLSYDQKTDTSLISCFPLTGRQHQLRVHLQALGFPIHNDVLYGGKVENDSKNIMKMKVFQAMNEAVKQDRCHLSKDERVTDEIIEQAKEVCLSCKGNSGIEKSFNSAQLLVQGHEIDLHALAYRIKFRRKEKKKKSKENKKDEQPLAILELSVKSPSWANPSLVSNLSWLDI